MTFRTRLFQALQRADVVTCNGHPVTAKMLECPDGLLQPYVDLGDGSTLYIEDSEIQVDGEGIAYGTARDGKEAVVWRFRIVKPLSDSDVQVIEPVRRDIHDVVGRLQQLRR